MVTIATSKSGVIERMRVTAVTAIAPCVGGLLIWYPDHNDEGFQTPEQQGDSETGPSAAESPDNRLGLPFRQTGLFRHS